MANEDRFRDAASIHVDLPPERVEELLGRPSVLRALDDRWTEHGLEIDRGTDQIEVSDEQGRVHVRFRVTPEGDGAQIAAMENTRPDDVLEATKRMLFPGQSHKAFERELKRLRALLDAVDQGG